MKNEEKMIKKQCQKLDTKNLLKIQLINSNHYSNKLDHINYLFYSKINNHYKSNDFKNNKKYFRFLFFLFFIFFTFEASKEDKSNSFNEVQLANNPDIL